MQGFCCPPMGRKCVVRPRSTRLRSVPAARDVRFEPKGEGSGGVRRSPLSPKSSKPYSADRAPSASAPSGGTGVGVIFTMSERTPIDLLAVSAISALGTLALVYSGWALVDNWMRRVGRVA